MVVRLRRDKKDLQSNPISGVQIEWPENDLKHWIVLIDGPADSYYEGDVFTFDLTFGPGYPKQRPDLKITTPILHPNMSCTLGVCINVLTGDYALNAETLTVRVIIEQIIYALKHPNPEEDLDINAANLLKSSPDRFRREVQKQISQNVIARLRQ
jgi:ubiquitin-protein ligase